ncbi:mutator type transposase [Tanacetum coccineum]
MDGTGRKIRKNNVKYQMPIEYEKDHALFSIKLHHVGKFKELDKRKYVNGLVDYVDGLDIDKFSVHELNEVMVELGYANNDDHIYYHYMIPVTDLEIGLRALGNDLDVLGLAKSSVVIEELPSSSMIHKKGLLLKYHKPSSTPHVTPSWTWFLECLGDDLGMTKESNFTFINDRQKGLAIAMANVFPCAEHRYCLRHIHENMKKQWNGQAYKELLWRCAAATTVPYFDRAMEELKEFNKEAFEWLAKIPAHSWSRSHFSGRAKSDILLNNLCECFNGKILDARDAPIITALEYIREYLMRRMVNVIVVINKTDGPLTPSATKLLKVAMDKANKYTIGFNGGKSMRKWELTGIPCAHAIATNYNMALNGIQVSIPEEWVHKCYWLATWKHAYSYTLGCLNEKTKEEKAQMVKDGKLSRAYKTVTCNKCGNLGHNSRSCKGQKDPMNATGTSTSQRFTNIAVGTRKRPSDAGTTPSTAAGTRKRPSDVGTTPSTALAKKKQATRSSNAGTTPSTAPATGSGQNRMTRAGFCCSKEANEKWKDPHLDFCVFCT